MDRRTILMAAALALPPALGAAQANAERQDVALAALKRGIIGTLGYADPDLDLAQRASQFWVKIVNAPLNAASGAEREADATRIVAAIAQATAGQAAYAGILGIHIDYVRRNPVGDAIEVVEAIDFRKTQAGSFVLHVS